MPNTPLPLKDIHLPAHISWWPPAIGWWILAALILLLLVTAVWLYKRLTRATAYKSAKKTFAALQHNSALDKQQKIQQLSILMRRVAISEYSRAQTASLSGPAWLAFLDQGLPDQPFSNGIGRLLIDAPFRPTEPLASDVTDLFILCEKWLKNSQKQARKVKTR